MTATPKSFTRIVSHKYFMNLIKEARRVKYIVKQDGREVYDVRDDETGEVVFFGIKQSPSRWIASFSTLYWQEPPMPA